MAIHFHVFLFSPLSRFQVEGWIFFLNLEASTRNDMGLYFEFEVTFTVTMWRFANNYFKK